MADIFSGLESMGLGKLADLDVFSSDEEKKKIAEKAAMQKKKELEESDYLFDKSYKCPCCDHEFKTKTVKTGKAHMISADTDLRPKYQGIDPLKYDAVVCPSCGYAAINKYFESLMFSQAKLIKENITKNFTGLDFNGEIFTYDYAIQRYKLALVSTIIKKGRLSERAYVCLKAAWVLRGKSESLSPETPNYNQVIAELKAEEKGFIEKACVGFTEAFSKETFPICGMDEHTATYLVADLCRQTGRYDEANRWISRVITSKSANERIKQKARDIRDMIAEEQNESK